MTKSAIKQNSGRGRPELPVAGKIHLWRTDLDESLGDISFLRRLLSPSELARSHRFVFEKHRRRFIIAKAWTRSVLGFYLVRKPCDVPLIVDERGKPRIKTAENHFDLRFSLSHCGSLALLAVTVGQDVGVDIQNPLPEDLWPVAAARFLTTDELACIKDLSPTARALALAEVWTRKESVAKALGTGLTSQVFSYAVGPSTWGTVRCGGRLLVRSLLSCDRFAGAVAVRQDF